MTIINIFSERIKREMPEITGLLTAYMIAVRNIEDWEAEATAIWGEVAAKVEKLVGQAVVDDDKAVDKLVAWSKESGVDISQHVDKMKRHMPKVIAEAIVSAMVTFGSSFTAAMETEEDAVEPEKPTDGPKAV